LEHLLVQQQLGDELFEPVDLGFQFTTTAVGVDLRRVVALPPAIVGGLRDAKLSTHIGDCQPPGQIAISLAQGALDLVGVPSLAHESLRD
jgi:hypothetical protein